MRDDKTIDHARKLAPGAGADLAAFYDRRAAAALAYCSRLCAPDAIADAVEASFARVFEAAAADGPLDGDELDRRLRSSVRSEAAARASVATAGMPARRLLERLADPSRGGACELMPALLAARADGALTEGDLDRLQQHLRRCAECRTVEHRFDEAERAFDALAGEEAPALGRSLLAEMVADAPLSERRRFTRERLAAQPPDWLQELDWDEEAEAYTVVVEDDDGEEQGARSEEQGAGSGEQGAGSGEEGAELEDQPVVRLEPAPGDTAAFPPVTRTRLRLGSVLHPAGRIRRKLAVAMLVAGLLLFAEGALTVVWKEPFTALLTARAQDALADELEELGAEQAIGAADERRIAAIDDVDERTKERIEVLARRERETVPTGGALGTLTIRDIGMERVVVKGVDDASLRKGPGHYDQGTFLPGEGRSVGIAGHRTTYDAPFRKLDELERGDLITMKMPYGLFVYTVERERIVPDDFRGAFEDTGGEQLVLSACHPLYSASERILVYAKLEEFQPLGAAAVEDPESSVTDAQEAARAKAARLERMGDRLLSEGMTGPDVKEVQRLLGLPQTGTFGPETTAAVLEFQRTHDLPVVGQVGPQTKAALARRERPPSRPPTPPPVPPQETTEPSRPVAPPESQQAVPPSPTQPDVSGGG